MGSVISLFGRRNAEEALRDVRPRGMLKMQLPDAERLAKYFADLSRAINANYARQMRAGSAPRAGGGDDSEL